MIQHLLNVKVTGQELPKAVFRLTNTTDTPLRGQVVVMMKRALHGQFEHRFAAETLAPGQARLFFVEIPKVMYRFYPYDWWWVTDDGQVLKGSGFCSGVRKTFEGKRE